MMSLMQNESESVRETNSCEIFRTNKLRLLLHTHRPMNHAIVGYFHRGGYSPMHFVGNRSNELEFLQHDHITIR